MCKPLLVILFLAGLFGTTFAYSQSADGEIFCGKKWYCEMTKDADGTTHPPEAGTEKDFMYFLCDSTFVLTENGIVLKGKWSYDDSTRTIKLQQKQLDNIPESFSFHIIESDEGHLVIIGQEGTSGEETAYLFSKQ